MRKRSVLILIAALGLVALIGISVSVASDSDSLFGGSALKPYTKGHANSGGVSAAKCGSCHSNGSGSDAHATHFRTLLLAFNDSTGHNGCARCHSEGVSTGYEGDLSYNDTGTTSKIRKQVDPSVCVRCHGNFSGTAGHAGYDINSNCLSCHIKGQTSGALGADKGHDTDGGMVADWVNRTVVDNTSVWQYCTLCHGQDGSGGIVSNRVLFETTETNPNTWP